MTTPALRLNAFDEAVIRIAMKQSKTAAQGADRLFDYLRTLSLPQDDYAIFGSGPLIVRRWVHGTNDLDVVCRGLAWDAACRSGAVSYDEQYDVALASHCGGRVTFGTSWGIGKFDIDELIDTAESIDGLPFVRLQHVIEYKRIRSSPKDLLHIEQYRLARATKKRGLDSG